MLFAEVECFLNSYRTNYRMSWRLNEHLFHLGDEQLIELLIKSKICGAELKKTRQPHALHEAAKLGKFFNIFIENQIMFRIFFSIWIPFNSGDSKIIQLLIRNGFNPNARTGHSLSPVHIAAYNGNIARSFV